MDEPRTSSPPNILVVDDDRDCRAAVVMLLRDEGLSTVEAANGKVAIDYLGSAALLPAVILLDLNMPVMSGWEVIDTLRSHDRFSTIPIVLITGESPRADLRRAFVAAVLPKPFSADELLPLVRRLSNGA